MQAVERISNFMRTASGRFIKFFSDFYEKDSDFTEDEISEYMALTHLTKEQILQAYNHFSSMQPQCSSTGKNHFLPRDQAMNMPEFQVNPFKDRMITVFSTREDGLSFEDYLDMMSVLSKSAPVDLKAEYAFQIYDFDGDDFLSTDDLINLMKNLKADREMEEKDMKEIAVKILMDGDVDGDGCLAFTEFLHLVARLKDFKSSFIIRL